MAAPTVLAGAEPFSSAGGRVDGAAGAGVGALLCHGFTGTPQSLRPWAEHLAAAGLAVELPLLPGHGTSWRALGATRWPEWYAEVEAALHRLLDRCDRVFVMALSMGGTLALRLAEQHGEEIAGLVLVNTSLASDRLDVRLALPVLRHVLPSLPGVAGDLKDPAARELAYDRTPLAALWSLTRLWRIVRADLSRVTQPLLVVRSRVDHVVEPVSGRVLLAGVGSTEVRELVLEDSYHVAPLDHDAPLLFAASLDFVRAHTGAQPAGALRDRPQASRP